VIVSAGTRKILRISYAHMSSANRIRNTATNLSRRAALEQAVKAAEGRTWLEVFTDGRRRF